MVNRVILIGNLGRDPEVRRLESGAAVAKFSVATSESYLDKASNEWKEQTEWHEIVAWRNRAEQAERIFKKGVTVYIEGKLTHRKYTDANNVEKWRTEVVANYMRKIKDPGGMGGGNSNYFPSQEPPATANTGSTQAPPATPTPPPTTTPTAAAAPDAPVDAPADDLPF